MPHVTRREERLSSLWRDACRQASDNDEQPILAKWGFSSLPPRGNCKSDVSAKSIRGVIISQFTGIHNLCQMPWKVSGSSCSGPIVYIT